MADFFYNNESEVFLFAVGEPAPFKQVNAVQNISLLHSMFILINRTCTAQWNYLLWHYLLLSSVAVFTC